MNNPIISAIAALDQNRGIAKQGKIPWRIPDDMKHFKNITTGHIVIMGRKTYESMGKPLPNRTNYIITRNHDYMAEGCSVFNDIAEAFDKARKEEPSEIFIIGGAEIYSKALPQTEKLYLTLIEKSFDCDTFFPEYAEFKSIISREDNEYQGLKYSYITLSR